MYATCIFNLPAYSNDDNPDFMNDFAKKWDTDPNFAAAMKNGDVEKFDKDLTPNIRGHVRAAQFGSSWPRGSLSEAIKRFAPNSKGVFTSKGKVMYLNPRTGIQVVYDKAGNYFRIENTMLSGKRVHLDLDGNPFPNNKIVNGKQMGMNQGEYNQISHYINID